MRLISIIGLTLLLVFAVGATAHGSADAASAGTSSVAGETAAADGVAVTADAPALQSAGSESVFDPAAGALLCVLGILCGLVAAILLHRLVRRRSPLLGYLRVVLATIGATVRHAPPRPSSLSLTTLSISRT